MKTNVPQYSAYAKAHLLSGRSAGAVHVIDDMVQAGVGPLDSKAAVEYLQYWVILCYSSTTRANKSALSGVLQQYAHLVTEKVPNSAKRQWRQLSELATTLISGVSRMRFPDILVTFQAREAGKTGSLREGGPAAAMMLDI